MSRRTRCLIAAVTALSFAAPAGASASTSAQAIAALNQQRAANGIAPLTEDPALSDGCAKHVAYMTLNGMNHGEDPSRPGYTPEGAEAHAEVISPTMGWDNVWTSPWAGYPLHLENMFDPAHTTVGYADNGQYACMRFDSYGGSATAATYPGAGTAGVPLSLDATGEGPFSPQEAVGLPARPVGFNIIFYTASPQGVTADAYTLRGPHGPVAARLMDQNTLVDGQPADFGGGIMVPEQPLEPYSTYTATVAWHQAPVSGEPEARYTQSTTFETTGRPNELLYLDLDALRRDRTFRVTVNSDAPNPHLTLTGPGGRRRRPALDRRGRATVRLNAGRWMICASSGGRDVGYLPKRTCRHLVVRVHKTMPVKLARKRDRRGRVLITARRPALGRRATLTFQGQWRGWRRRVKLHRRTLVRVPAGMRLFVSVPGFTDRVGVIWKRVELDRAY